MFFRNQRNVVFLVFVDYILFLVNEEEEIELFLFFVFRRYFFFVISFLIWNRMIGSVVKKLLYFLVRVRLLFFLLFFIVVFLLEMGFIIQVIKKVIREISEEILYNNYWYSEYLQILYDCLVVINIYYYLRFLKFNKIFLFMKKICYIIIY